MKTILSILICCGALAFAASAADAQKIATIDLRKVFDNYWKTKRDDATLNEEARQLEKDTKMMFDQFQKAQEKYKKTIDGVNDPVISTTEKEKRKKDAEEELLGLRDMETKIKKFDASSRAQLQEKQRRIRDNILGEIRDTIKAKVKTGGYTLVIDSAAETPNGTPIILYNSGADDLSDVVLKELNVSAPADYPGKDKPVAPPK